MRKTSSRRTALLLSVLVLIVPSTVGAGVSATTQPDPMPSSSPTCSPEAGDSESGNSDSGSSKSDCDSSDSPGLGKRPSPSDPSSPGTPSEEPTDPASPEPTDPGGLGVKDPDDDPDEKLDGKFPKEAQSDDNAPVFTETPGALGSESLSFKGLKGISFVSVPKKTGKKVVTLKIQADEISISGFSLTVKPPDEEYGLVTTADTMTLKGDVSVYIGSITATTKDGKSLTLGADTPPAMDDVKPGLLRVTMGLVGSTADSINYTNTDQRLKKG